MTIPKPLFDLREADRAADDWGFNCGPAAIAVMNEMTIEELRPHLGDFESKRYTNPTLMWAILESIGAKWRPHSVRDVLASPRDSWPDYGLARVQWEGPWTNPGVPIAARYRHTHWVGALRIGDQRGIFDVNCLNNSTGWVALPEWIRTIVPFITKQCHPKANGNWHLTHSVEIDRVGARAQELKSAEKAGGGTVSSTVTTPGETLRSMMVAIHRITPELAEHHVGQMTDAEIAEHLDLYRRSAEAVRTLMQMRKERPDLWLKIREWAERESQ